MGSFRDPGCSRLLPVRSLPLITLLKTATPSLLAVGIFLLGSSQPLFASVAPTTTTLAITSGGNAVTTVSSGSVITLTASVMAGSAGVTPGQVQFCDATAPHCQIFIDLELRS
jgi:hypothetical protein